jgi:hypothetical protein
MGIWGWLSQNKFDLFSSAGIGGLFVTAIAAFADARAHRRDAEAHELDAKAQQQNNLLTITGNHRELWLEYLHNPALKRVRDAKANLKMNPVTEPEHVFLTLVIAHTNTVFHGTDHGLVFEYEGLRQDVAEFFSLPIPRAVWRKVKPLQNHDFAQFIDSSLKNDTL